MPDLRFLTEPGVEPEQPSLARIADWLLGGTQNRAIDRAAGEQLTAMNPEVRDLLRESRLFAQRAVAYALREGVRQFVDIGSGLPTQGCVHEVADQTAGGHDATVVYVDVDPVAVAHADLLLRKNGDPTRQHAVAGDLLDSEGLWRRLTGDGLIDPERPVCLLVTALLHFVKDEMEPARHLAHHRSRLAPGSLLVLSQSTDEGVENSRLEEQAAEFHQQENPGQMRGRAELAAFFGDFELVEPGITFTPEWHPSLGERSPFADHPAGSQQIGGLGRKP
jgi:O-methyltransferase involved in polyketide biosynthesis